MALYSDGKIACLVRSLIATNRDRMPSQIEEWMAKKDTDLALYFDECFEFINEAKMKGGGLLVHCYMGRSRSVTIVVAYIMKRHGLSHSQTLNHVRSKRPQAAPNSGFVKQLREFGKSLLDARNDLTVNSHDEAVTKQTRVIPKVDSVLVE